jgi:hypothetical protein
VTYGQEANGISFDKLNPHRFCTSLGDDVLNVVVLDESRVLPDFLIHDWIQSTMFELIEPRRTVNLILEKGDAELVSGANGLEDDQRGPVIRRKGDAMVGEREREERKIHLWRDGRYKNLFCNNSILVVQTKACSPVERNHQFIHKYLQQAQQLKISILGIIHSDDEYPDYRKKVVVPAPGGEDLATAMAQAGESDEDEDDVAEEETLEVAKRDLVEGEDRSSANSDDARLPQSSCSDRDWYTQADFVYRPYWSRAIKQRYPNVK